MTKNYNDLGVEFKYLIVNDMDQKYGLWVNTVGFQSIQPNSPYPLRIILPVIFSLPVLPGQHP